MAENLLTKQETYLEAGIHIGTKLKAMDMDPFIYRMRNDGLYVLDLRKIDERIRMAGKLLAQYAPEDILVVASRTYSGNAASIFSQQTGIKVFQGRFIPGILTNVSRSDFVEPKLLLVCDPKGERQATIEAGTMGIPAIGLCDTDNFTGGVTNALVTDNLKAAVTKSSKYEPVINESFAAFADHYNIAVLPTRTYHPRDKSLVEGAVKIIYTRIYASLRGMVFHTLEELNQAILQALEEHNNKLLKGRYYSRRMQFEEIERATLHPLPKLKYEHKKQVYATVMKNGHVCLSADKHYYSVPYKHIGKKVKILYTNKSVEVFYNYQRIACHARIKSPHNYTTDKDHMASTHRFVSDWTPEKFLSWAAGIDEVVRQYIYVILNKKQHVEQAYKSCVGILTMAKHYGNQRLINACKRGIEYDMYSYKSIEMILKRGLDIPEPEETQLTLMPMHDNIRGENYYN